MRATVLRLSPSGRFLWRLVGRFSAANCSLLASGIAFYGLLSIIPGFAVLISAFGLIADPHSVQHLIDSARGVFPNEALSLLSAQLQALLEKHNTQLSIGLITGLAVTLWSARAAAAAVMAALNMVYKCDESRNLVIQQGVALGLTVGGIIATLIGLVAVGVLPALLALLPVDMQATQKLTVIRWPFLGILIISIFAFMYRYAPCRPAGALTWRTVASATGGTLLWIVGSGLFSFYVSSLGSYDRMYGSLGAVVVLLMWFYVSALALLLGAVIDAEWESLKEGSAS